MAQINFRIDDDLKTQADTMFREMGMNTSTAVNIFITQAVLRHRMPFEIISDPFYNERNMSVLRRRAREMQEGGYSDSHELIEDGVPAYA